MPPGRTERGSRGGGRGAARGGRGDRGGRGGRGGRGRGRSGTTTSTGAQNADTTEATPAARPSQPEPVANEPGSRSDSIRPDEPSAPSSSRPAAQPATRATVSGHHKFVPKATRRSRVDREAIAQEELQRQESRAALDARLKRLARGRGGRRARGGGGPRDRIIRGGSGALGPFSEAPSIQRPTIQRSRIYDYGSSANGSGAGSGWSSIKSEPGSSKDGVISSSAKRDVGKRLNTEKLSAIVIDDDEEEEETKGKEKTPLLLPKGLERDDPDDEIKKEADVASEAELDTADRGETGISTPSSDDIFITDANEMVTDDNAMWPGAPEGRQVKVEGEEVTEIDTLTNRRATKMPAEPDQGQADSSQSSAIQAKKTKIVRRDPEEDEYANNLAYQRRLFGVPDPEDSDHSDITTADTRKPAIAPGELYLFQFPPILPPLQASAPLPQTRVKNEPTDDAVILDAPMHNPSETVDLTADDARIKQEEDAEASVSKSSALEKGGFVGKLLVRKSGKMEIDYGGMIFSAEAGIPIQFLRTAILTEMDDTKNPDGYAGTAYGMGQLTGNFVAVPKWSEEDEWIVDPSELPPNGVGAG